MKNQAVPALVKPPPIVWANSPRTRTPITSRLRLARCVPIWAGPRTRTPITSRLRLARSVPSTRMLWLAQVALSAKKKAERKAGSKCEGRIQWAGAFPRQPESPRLRGIRFMESGSQTALFRKRRSAEGGLWGAGPVERVEPGGDFGRPGHVGAELGAGAGEVAAFGLAGLMVGHEFDRELGPAATELRN